MLVEELKELARSIQEQRAEEQKIEVKVDPFQQKLQSVILKYILAIFPFYPSYLLLISRRKFKLSFQR